MSKPLEILVTLQDRDAFIVTPRLVDHNMWDITRGKHKWFYSAGSAFNVAWIHCMERSS